MCIMRANYIIQNQFSTLIAKIFVCMFVARWMRYRFLNQKFWCYCWYCIDWGCSHICLSFHFSHSESWKFAQFSSYNKPSQIRASRCCLSSSALFIRETIHSIWNFLTPTHTITPCRSSHSGTFNSMAKKRINVPLFFLRFPFFFICRMNTRNKSFGDTNASVW